MIEPEDKDPGWKPDPEDPAARRYWDGSQWSGNAVPNDAAAGSTPNDQTGVAAGWYPDPSQSGQQRYWDGTEWTEHVQPQAGIATQVPVPVQPTTVVAYAQPKSIGLAIFLSIILPGVGHLYAGVKTDFGVVFLVISIVNIVLSLVTLGIWACIGFFVWAGMAIWAAIDVNSAMKRLIGIQV